MQASSGTLFLDEVGDVPQSLQAKLLRALEERVVHPVGGAQEVPFDARVFAATNRDLERAIDEGRLREDLYYRSSVLLVSLPPLRARGSDVLLLALVPLEEAERRYILRVLEAAGGNKSLAAKTLGLNRKTQYRRLAEYGIVEDEARATTNRARRRLIAPPASSQSWRRAAALVCGGMPGEVVVRPLKYSSEIGLPRRQCQM